MARRAANTRIPLTSDEAISLIAPAKLTADTSRLEAHAMKAKPKNRTKRAK